MERSLGIKRPVASFQSGTHLAKRSCFLENGINIMEVKVEAHASKSDNVKSRDKATDLDNREAELGRTGAAHHIRKSNDSPAVVPIKKRRIQIYEATQSPSPPSSLPWSSCQELSTSHGAPSPPSRLPRSSDQELSPSHQEACTPSLSNSSFSGVSPVSSPRPTYSTSEVPSSPQACPSPVLDTQSVACEADLPKVLKQSEECPCSKLDPSEPLTKVEDLHNDDNDILARPGYAESINGQIAENIASNQVCCQTKSEGQLVRTESGSCSKDDRLHWDLNTDMAAWDESTEQGISQICKENCTPVTPSRSPSEELVGVTGEEGNMNAGEQQDEDLDCMEEGNTNASEQQDEDLDCTEEGTGNYTECIPGEDSEENGGFVGMDPHALEVVPDETEAGEQVINEYDNVEPVEDGPDMGSPTEEDPNTVDQDFSGNSERRDTKEEATSPSVHPQCAGRAADAPADYPDADKPGSWDPELSPGGRDIHNALADYPDAGKPGSWDAELSPVGRDMHDNLEMVSCHGDLPERQRLGKQGKLSTDNGEDGWNDEPELEEHVDYGDSDCKDADDPGIDADDRTSLTQVESRWNEEDGPKPIFSEEDALGTDDTLHSSLPDSGQHPEKPVSSGRSRATGWDQLPEGFESAEEALRAAKEEATRRIGHGSSWSNCAGRGSLNTTNRFGPSSVRSHNRDDFSSARGDNYYAERHSGESMHDRDGFRHGRRADDNFSVRGRDPSRRPGVFGRGRANGWSDSQPGHMNQWGSGRHRSGSGYNGPSSAIAVPPGRPDNSGFLASSDGNVAKNGMGPVRGGLRSVVSGGRMGRGSHTRGPPVDMDGGAHYPLRGDAVGDRVAGMGLGYSGNMRDRSGRGKMDMYRGGGMDSRRSLSPRRPHVLDHSNMMGRVQGMRLDSRVVRSPPMHCSMGSSDFNAVRNQRSPPSSRWLNEQQREPDGYQDRDFKRPMPRTRLPPQRTLPHVVHGSSLTDERDRQVLSQHSPPLKSSLAPSQLRKSKADSLDSRPLKRIEEDDVRYAGLFGKDGDYRRGSPPREIGREREKGSLYRRDRERDDERRRDFRRSSSRDARFPSGSRYSSFREGDDDVAPRRRRPS